MQEHRQRASQRSNSHTNRPLGARTKKGNKERPLSNIKARTMVDSYFSEKCLFTQSNSGASNEAKK